MNPHKTPASMPVERAFKIGDIVETIKGAKFWGRIIALDTDEALPGCTVLAVDLGFVGTKHVYPLKQIRRRYAAPSMEAEAVAIRTKWATGDAKWQYIGLPLAEQTASWAYSDKWITEPLFTSPPQPIESGVVEALRDLVNDLDLGRPVYDSADNDRPVMRAARLALREALASNAGGAR